ncbi:MAG: hypothetical protein J5808_07610 [Paludibacteraceae bacterium]|nr:hypothetical protein [Paludibacteraceae bacterium]
MKKLIVLAALMVAGVVAAVAQPRAIGARLGYGVEFSYEHGLGDNMLSIEAGLNGFTGVQAAVTYDWIFPISSWEHKGEWNWYAGVGAGAGFGWPLYRDYAYDAYGNTYVAKYGYSRIGFGVAGRIGVEYNFWFPLQLSVDWRPVIGPELVIADDPYLRFYDAGMYSICLGVRYKF